MVKYSQLTAEIYKPKEIASMIGVNVIWMTKNISLNVLPIQIDVI